MFASTALILVLAAIALTLGMSVKRIPEGHVYSLRRRGQPAPRLLKPGMHWVWPLLERVVHRISLAGRSLDLSDAGDTAGTACATVYWQVLEPERADAVIERAEDMIRERVREALPRLRGDADPHARELELKRLLNAELAPHGIFVARARLQPG